jgi:2-hydroxy-6-oxonona-2,4-dienedioate hydrolase
MESGDLYEKINYLKLSNGETIAYRICNQEQAKVLLLIHGMSASSYYFESIISSLPRDYKIYSIDLRGFGHSSYSNKINSLEDFVEDINLFLQSLKIEKLSIMGWSTGGAIALNFTLNFPEKIHKLILIAPVGPLGIPVYQVENKKITKKRSTTLEQIQNNPILVKPYLYILKNKNKELMTDLFINYTFKNPPKKIESYIDQTFLQRNVPDVMWALNSFNITDNENEGFKGNGKLKNLKNKILILAGKYDKLVPLKVINLLYDLTKNRARLEIFNESGHTPWIDEPENFSSIVNEFISE